MHMSSPSGSCHFCSRRCPPEAAAAATPPAAPSPGRAPAPNAGAIAAPAPNSPVAPGCWEPCSFRPFDDRADATCRQANWASAPAPPLPSVFSHSHREPRPVRITYSAHVTVTTQRVRPLAHPERPRVVIPFRERFVLPPCPLGDGDGLPAVVPALVEVPVLERRVPLLPEGLLRVEAVEVHLLTRVHQHQLARGKRDAKARRERVRSQARLRFSRPRRSRARIASCAAACVSRSLFSFPPLSCRTMATKPPVTCVSRSSWKKWLLASVL